MVFVQLLKSVKDGKKYTAIFYNDDRSKIKTVHFGAKGYEDFTIHGDEERKQRYIQRHKTRENFADYKTAGSLSYHILWNKPSVSASYNDCLNFFK